MAESLVSDQEEEALLATVPGQGAATVYRTETALPGSYASVADVLRVNMPEDAKEDFAIETIEQWLRIAKNDVDSYLGNRFRLPLTKWSEMIVWAQGELAVCGMLGQRGVRSVDETLRLRIRKRTAVAFLKRCRDRQVTPDPTLSDERLGTMAPRYRGRGADRHQCDVPAVSDRAGTPAGRGRRRPHPATGGRQGRPRSGGCRGRGVHRVGGHGMTPRRR